MRVPSWQKLIIPLIATFTAIGSAGASTFSAALPQAGATAARIPDPAQYFGFEMGTTGKLAGYSKVLSYFDLISRSSSKVDSHHVGATTMGNDYKYLTISSPRNLRNFDRIVQSHRRLANPRGLTEAEAHRIVRGTVPIYYIEATIHSTEVGNGQAIVDIVHRLATERSDFTRKVLSNSVILLVPSQNPDGQQLVIDYFHDTAGTNYERVYPDLYHKYTGHDNNRDWFMFTQVETRYRVKLMQRFHPPVAHLMHQMGNDGMRIFVPPYSGVKSPDIPPNAAQAANAIGQEAARDLTGAGKAGVGTRDYPIWWTADVTGWHTYQGTALYLSEIASVRDLAYPQKSPDGEPLGPQTPRMSLPEPYRASTWTLEQIVDYAKIAAYSGMEYVADHGKSLLYNNVYEVARKAASGKWTDTYAYVIPRDQHDSYGTYELLRKLEFGDVVIKRATEPFTAAGTTYKAGSYVIEMAQPLGRFARQVLKVKDYPDYRLCDGCPVSMPYSDAGPSLPLFLGVEVVEVDDPFDASLRRVRDVEPRQVPMPEPPTGTGAYLVPPDSYGVFHIVDALQDEGVPTFRAAREFQAGGHIHPAGTFVLPPTKHARTVLKRTSVETGVHVFATDRTPRLSGFQLEPDTRIGLHRGVGNMAGGWMMWLFDQYDFNYELVGSKDFGSGLNSQYDVIVLPHGISKKSLVQGLSEEDYPKRFSWAYGIGEDGWRRLREFVTDGGTLLAIGSSVETARKLLDLPVEPVIGDQEEVRIPGSFLAHRYRGDSPVAWGMPPEWPTWFAAGDQAYRVTDPAAAEVVSRYPSQGELLASGYASGADVLHGTANVISYQVGDGYVVTYGSEIGYRTWPRASMKLLFNAMFHGPSREVRQRDLSQGRTAGR